MINELVATYKYRHVIYYFVYTSIKVRYKRTFLGYLWTVLTPMAYYLVLGLIFSYGLKAGMPERNYYVYLISGAIIFSAISSIINQSCNIMMANEGYIKKIYVPKLVFILNVVFYELTNFILIFISVLLLGFITKHINFSYHFFFSIVPIVFLIFFASGAAMIMSVASVYFRDLIHITPVVLNAFFFGTPIMWYKEMAPPIMSKLNMLNPFYYFVELFRTPFLNNEFPDIKIMAITMFFSFIIFLVGLLLLNKLNNRIIFKL